MSDTGPEFLAAPTPPIIDVRARAVAVLEILLCSSVPTQLAIGAALRATGMAPNDPAGHLSLPFVLILSLADTIVLVVMMTLLMRAHGESAARVWLGGRDEAHAAGRVGTRDEGRSPARHAWREIGVGLATVPLVFIAVGILLNTIRLVAPSLHNVKDNPLEQLAGTPAQAALFSLVAIIAGGVREELQRAFMLRRFEQYLGGAGAGVVVLSIAFGLGHTVQGWDAVITTGTLGAFWAWMYLRRRNSISPIVSHAGFNTLEILRVAVLGQ
jgi:membrane protease YdiL (CAAX protease family)